VNVSQQSSLVSQQRYNAEQLVNAVRVSSATSAGVRQLISVCYAMQIVVSADELAIGDAINLHR